MRRQPRAESWEWEQVNAHSKLGVTEQTPSALAQLLENRHTFKDHLFFFCFFVVKACIRNRENGRKLGGGGYDHNGLKLVGKHETLKTRAL
jgi:hypothetical protein